MAVVVVVDVVVDVDVEVDVDVDVDVVVVDVDVLDVDRWLGSSRSQDFPSWSRCTRRWARCCPPRDACVGNNIGGNSGFLTILIMQSIVQAQRFSTFSTSGVSPCQALTMADFFVDFCCCWVQILTD